MANGTNDENTLYQALIVEDQSQGKESPFSQGIRTTLLTLPKSEFPPAIQEGLPSKGTTIKDDFLPLTNSEGQVNQDNVSKRYGARTMLMYRKVSQLVAKSWMSSNIYIDKIMTTAN